MFDRAPPNANVGLPASATPAPGPDAMFPLDTGTVSFLKALTQVIATTFDVAHVAVSLLDGPQVAFKAVSGADPSLEWPCSAC